MRPRDIPRSQGRPPQAVESSNDSILVNLFKELMRTTQA